MKRKVIHLIDLRNIHLIDLRKFTESPRIPEPLFKIETVKNSIDYEPDGYLNPEVVANLCDNPEWDVHIRGLRDSDKL